MLSLFIFFVLLFGLLGIFISQYINQYREAYVLWIENAVYGQGDELPDCKDKAKLCSKLESYSREICELSHLIIIIFTGIAIVFLTLVYMITVNIPLIGDESTIYYEFLGVAYFSSNYEINVLLAARIFAFLNVRHVKGKRAIWNPAGFMKYGLKESMMVQTLLLKLENVSSLCLRRRILTTGPEPNYSRT